uniref:C-CAP/cofactor C-like domain-containing protein n=1 Tax=Lygus hesperus TaxID=30085 RepID=A0A0K8TAQ4_LYGHE
MTSVMVEHSVNGVFAFPCQQLRVHNTKSTDFHIHVTTRAIIEDTTGVRFGPYRYSYDGLDAHYEESGLDRDRNNWDDIDDFNWLVNNKQSPNWTKIPQEDQELFLDELKHKKILIER